MEIKREIITALQLCVLLHLLYWSFTWNLPSNHDIFAERNEITPTNERSTNSRKEVVDLYPKRFPQIKNKHAIVMESFMTVKSASEKALRISSKTETFLPPFYTWMKAELTKQDADTIVVKNHDKPASSRRKLNYASSKCGAKILMSNSEAKYPFFILNEKVDEYMLNPCRASVWFIIELCDTIEVTQIELANYELYSSSPKTFSTLWSDIYPTQRWRHLGTFEAKDQRTMQTFNVTAQNLGKFIKVIIFDHHGREHYCPMSVFRVLGYSMITVYDQPETEENSVLPNQNAGNGTLPKKENKLSSLKNKSSTVAKSDEVKVRFRRECIPCLKKTKVCQMQSKYCPLPSTNKKVYSCPNRLPCLFFKSITQQNKRFNCDCELIEKNVQPFITSKIRKEEKNFLNNLQICKVTDSNASKNIFTSNGDVGLTSLNLVQKSKKIDDLRDEDWIPEKRNQSEKANFTSHSSRKGQNIARNNNGTNKKNNVLEKLQNSGSSNHKEFVPNFIDSEDMADSKDDTVESAALIQKESVLSKLTNRIKASEMSLNLINRYLQQLSESYRHQMEDMQIMFNGTLKAIALASVKAAEIDEKQQMSIDVLERKVAALSNRIEYFVDGHNHLLKRVLELHGFFLILEFIIISTIFSIFVNKFKQRRLNIRAANSRINIWK